MLRLTLLIGAILALVGCSAIAIAPTDVSPITETSVQFSWVDSVPLSGFYMAEAEGYYRDENLALDMRTVVFDDEGKPISNITQVMDGEADFGVIDASLFLKARADGAPVIALATIFQRHPLALVSLAEANITRPEDLIGATVQIANTSTVIYQALLAAQNIDPALVNTIPRTDYSLAPILNGEVDVSDAWLNNEIVKLTLGDHTINTIFPPDYGIEMYATLIFTTEELVANQPDLVEQFLRATLRGMQGVIADPKKAAAVTVSYDESFDLEFTTEAIFQSLPLLKPANSQPGMMTAERWALIHEILLEHDVLSEPIDIESAYTLTFLEKIYKE